MTRGATDAAGADRLLREGVGLFHSPCAGAALPLH